MLSAMKGSHPLSYIEERIKFLAVTAWRRDRQNRDIACENDECEFPLIRAEIRNRECYVLCDECGNQQESIPEEVIDAFLGRIMTYL